MKNIKFTALFSQIPRTQPNGQTKNSFQSLLKFVNLASVLRRVNVAKLLWISALAKFLRVNALLTSHIRATCLSANLCKIDWSALIWWQLAQLVLLTFASHNILVCNAIINAQHVNHNVCELVIVLSHMLYLMRLI